MSYNIHHGEGIDGKLDLERIAKLIVDVKADIVGLQEVDRGCERTQKRDLPAELGKLTGLTSRAGSAIDREGPRVPHRCLATREQGARLHHPAEGATAANRFRLDQNGHNRTRENGRAPQRGLRSPANLCRASAKVAKRTASWALP